jgi:hypothetical protein
MKNRLKISLLFTKLSISQHIYVRYDIISNISFNIYVTREFAGSNSSWRPFFGTNRLDDLESVYNPSYIQTILL